MNDEIAVGEVTAYRVFRVLGGKLWALAKDYEWTPGENQARCNLVKKTVMEKVWINDPEGEGVLETSIEQGHGRIPSPVCTCGFWMYKSESSCRVMFADELDNGPSIAPFAGFGTEESCVMARVQGWGRTIVGASGYRAEKARIDALVTETPTAFADVLTAYQVDVVSPRTRAEEGISAGDLLALHLDRIPMSITTGSLDPENERGEFFVDKGSAGHVALTDVEHGIDIGSPITFMFDRREGGLRWVIEIQEQIEEEE